MLSAWKYGTKKRKDHREEPWGQCLTRPVPNCRHCSGFWLVPENVCVFLPNQKAERRRPFGTGLVRHCPQGLFSSFFTFLRATVFRPFTLSLATTICPWVSEDGGCVKNVNRTVEIKNALKTMIKKPHWCQYINYWKIRVWSTKSEIICTIKYICGDPSLKFKFLRAWDFLPF